MADTTTPTPPRPCNRCKEKPAVYDLRSAERVCPGCFAAFVAQKNMKRIEVMQRETRDARARPSGAGGGRGPPPPQRYLLALSGGPASVALLHLLSENLAVQRRAKGGRQRPRFELLVVHVDTENLGPYDDDDDDDEEEETEETDVGARARAARDPLLAPYRARYPDLAFLRVSLADALTLRTVDWTALFPDAAATPLEAGGEAHDVNESSSSSSSSSAAQKRATRLAWLLGPHGGGLATPSSRADVRRLLVRHVLLATAARARCDIVLLGCTTTALAELTLAETAKGRGFALPWLVNDGVAPVPASWSPPPPLAEEKEVKSLREKEEEEKEAQDHQQQQQQQQQQQSPTTIPVYSPLRDLLRTEIATYHTTLNPPLTDLFFGPDLPSSTTTTTATNTVVSHKDLSIDDVMRRYFADVELAYPSVVANVVRTTGKLVRDDGNNDDDGGEGPGPGAVRLCGLCGVGRDEAGDARWRGELGEPAPSPGPAGSGRSNGEQTRTPARRLCYGCERSVYG